MSTHITAKDLDLVVYDFDGVMTDNRVYVSQGGEEAVSCNRSDGLAVGMLRQAGLPQLILSTEVNEVVGARARKLGLDVIQACEDKAQALEQFCREKRYDLARVLYVGNDVNDLGAMRLVGFPVSPADGHPTIQSIAKLVVRAPGGAGVIRELADRLLKNDAPSAPPAAAASDGDLVEHIRAELRDAVKLRETLMKDQAMLERLCGLARTIAQAIGAGGKVIFAGNGGSFADAQHLAAEFVGRFMRERSPLAGICLGTNSSTVTAIGNDYHFNDIFVRELQAVARRGDVFIPISTSGNSGNLVEAIRAAQAMGLQTCALLGKGGGRIGEMCASIVVPSQHTARIQEIHITLGHVVCGLVDDLLDAQKSELSEGAVIFIIAEIGINHNGDLSIAKQLIDVAAQAGADAVKFQKRTIDKVYTQEFLDSARDSPWGKTQRAQKEGLELKTDDLREIDRYCKEKDIKWFSSAWDVESQRFLRQFDMPYNKIASAMIVYEDLLREVASEKRHTFISTGMSTAKDIDKAVEIFRSAGCPFELMHCVSTYPMNDDDANLARINTLRNRYKCNIGYSGHEVGLTVSIAAAALGVTSLERHITLDRAMYGSDQAASIEPDGFRRLVRAVRTVEKAIGDGGIDIQEKEVPIAVKLRSHVPWQSSNP